VTCKWYSQCYNDTGICFWANNDKNNLTASHAQAACQQQNSSTLPRITDDYLQEQLINFLYVAEYSVGDSGIWIDVHAVWSVDDWHWIDSTSASWCHCCMQHLYNSLYIAEHRAILPKTGNVFIFILLYVLHLYFCTIIIIIIYNNNMLPRVKKNLKKKKKKKKKK